MDESKKSKAILELRSRAARARFHAKAIGDLVTRARLSDLANELEARAAEMEVEESQSACLTADAPCRA